MRGLRVQAEAAIGVAHGVGEAARRRARRAADGAGRARRARRRARQRVVADAAADLDDGQHRRAASSAASAAAGPQAVSATAPPQAGGDLACHERAGARGDDGSVGLPARRLLDLAHLLAVEERRDRVDLRLVELVDVGAHEPGDPLARELDGGRAAVGRGTVVRSRWPSTRWTSALIANSSDATGHQPPRTGTRGAIAARFVRSAPV